MPSTPSLCFPIDRRETIHIIGSRCINSLTALTLSALVAACNPISDVKNILSNDKVTTEVAIVETEKGPVINTLRTPKSGGTNFDAILYKDLEILGAELAVIEAQEQIALLGSGRELQTSASIQGGTKSIKDSDSGAYGTLNASKLMYDRGALDLEIAAAEEKVDQSYFRYQQVAEGIDKSSDRDRKS